MDNAGAWYGQKTLFAFRLPLCDGKQVLRDADTYIVKYCPYSILRLEMAIASMM